MYKIEFITYTDSRFDTVRAIRTTVFTNEQGAVANEEFDKYDNDTYRMLLARDKSRWNSGYENPAVQKPVVLEWFENHLSWMDENVPYPTE